MCAARIAVVGSFMIDMVAKLPRWPKPGESLFATEFGIFQGGKGCNQAIAAARCGARVSMIGRLGADLYGDQFLQSLVAEGIDHSGIVRDDEEGTGIAIPLLLPDGQNVIVVAPRANMRLTATDVQAAGAEIRAADTLMLQLEAPIAASIAAAAIARETGATVIFNPAPVAPVPAELLAASDVVIVNEFEAEALTGVAPSDDDACWAAAEWILRSGVRAAIITLGSQGVFGLSGGRGFRINAYPVPVVDVTGAGDAFCGAFAAAYSGQETFEVALSLGNAAGALAVGTLGAARSLPRGNDIQRFLRGQR